MKSYEVDVLSNKSERSSQLLREMIYRDLINRQKQNYIKFKDYKQGKILQLLKGDKIDSKLEKKKLQNLRVNYSITNEQYNKYILTEFQKEQKKIDGQTDRFYSLIIQGQDEKERYQQAFHRRTNQQQLWEGKAKSMNNKLGKESVNSSIVNLKQSSYKQKQPPAQRQSSSDDQDMYMEANINMPSNQVQKHSDKIQRNQKTIFSQKKPPTEKNKTLSNMKQESANFTYNHHKPKLYITSDILPEIRQLDAIIPEKQDRSENNSGQSQEQDLQMSENDIQGIHNKKKKKKQKTKPVAQRVMNNSQTKANDNKNINTVTRQQQLSASIIKSSNIPNNNNLQLKEESLQSAKKKLASFGATNKHQDNGDDDSMQINDDDI